MTFGSQHYVPVLKIKRGEKSALTRLSVGDRTRVTPLLEVVERGDRSLEQHVNTTFAKLADSVALYSRCFLDVHELSSDDPHAANLVFARAQSTGMAFTPVVGLSVPSTAAVGLNYRAHGTALRLRRAEFEVGTLTSRIEGFLNQHQISATEVDLIVDLGAVEDLIPAGIAALAEAFMADIPDHPQWRTFTLSACSFPKGMGRVERLSHDFVERAEWLAWRDTLYARRDELQRLPTFSDCAIQHPAGVEGFDPRIMAVSAAVRYALSESWLLIKGQSTRLIPPSLQFPDLATRLVYGHLQSHFAGAGHCAGCSGMKDAADGAAGYGSAEAWRQLGTVHHMARVLEGLNSLVWP